MNEEAEPLTPEDKIGGIELDFPPREEFENEARRMIREDYKLQQGAFNESIENINPQNWTDSMKEIVATYLPHTAYKCKNCKDAIFHTKHRVYHDSDFLWFKNFQENDVLDESATFKKGYNMSCMNWERLIGYIYYGDNTTDRCYMRPDQEMLYSPGQDLLQIYELTNFK